MLHIPPAAGEKQAQSHQTNVFTYRSRQELRVNHEHAAICEIARRLAGLRGARYCGDLDLENEVSGKKQDAYRAAMALLRDGPVRIKPVRAKGGRGQWSSPRRPPCAAHLEFSIRQSLQNSAW